MLESCEPCLACGTVTPHARRRLAPLKLAAGLAAGGALAVLVPGPELVAIPLALLPLGLVRADRARRWDLACVRCRAKARSAERAPITAHTIIDFLM